MHWICPNALKKLFSAWCTVVSHPSILLCCCRRLLLLAAAAVPAVHISMHGLMDARPSCLLAVANRLADACHRLPVWRFRGGYVFAHGKRCRDRSACMCLHAQYPGPG